MTDVTNVLQFLKTKVDEIYSLKQSGDKSQVQDIYTNQLIPHLLNLRHLNRQAKEDLESKSARVKELNQSLMALYQACDSLDFEAACLHSEVTEVKEKSSPIKIPKPPSDIVEMAIEGQSKQFDAEAVSNLDHETRIRILEDEENRRRDLQEKLTMLTQETNSIEQLWSSTANMVEALKPHIKQLLDKVPK